VAPAASQSSSQRPETARAIDPPPPAKRAQSLAPDVRRNLNPPDPNAPAGPPPAFEASILDRAREQVSQPVKPSDIQLEPATPRDLIATLREERPYDVPPAPDASAEAEVATVRRIETPYDTATVDVAR
jgi:hypothetical protein